MKTSTLYLRAIPAPALVSIGMVGTVEIEAAAAGEGAKSLPKFSMTAYTGGPMRPKLSTPLDAPVVVDLAGFDISMQRLPALKDHDPKYLVGHTTSITSDGKTLRASGVISGTGDVAREVVANAANGFVWQVSIGSTVGDLEFVRDGANANVNGRLVAGPVYIARSGRLKEVSFLTMGADDLTSARIAAKAAGASPMDFEQWLKSKGFDLAAVGDQQKHYLQAQFDAELKAAKDTADDDEDPIKVIRAAASAEKKRISTISTITAKYAKKVEAGKLAEIEASAIDNEWDANKVELELLRAERPVSQGAGGSSAVSRRKLNASVITAALALTAGISEESIAKTLSAAEREAVMNEATGSAMRGFSLHALMDSVIHSAGQSFHGSHKSDSFIRAAIDATRILQSQGDTAMQADGFSTVSLSNVLSNVANKGLLASYSAVEVCWPNIAAVRNHSDFKAHTRVRLDSTGSFRKVGPDGELKNVGLSDAAYSNQVGTFGAIIALTRQMMINDDLGAFMEIPALLGRLGALRIEELVFSTLLSNLATFFASGNGNYVSGASSALGIDAITTGEQKFGDFVDSNGKPILVSPDRIVVGTALKALANQLFKDSSVIATGVVTSAKSLVTATNPHAGKYKVFASPYINNTAIKDQDGNALTGQSSTLWLLLADPAVRAAIAVAFLNGQRVPTIESSQTEFSTLGMQWRAYHDFGVGMEEITAGVAVAGV